MPDAPVPYRTPRLTLRLLDAGDREAFVRFHEASREHLIPWSPAAYRQLSPEALFEQQRTQGQVGLTHGTHLRLVGFLADGRLAGFFNLSEIVRGVFQNAYASWSVHVGLTRQGYGVEGATALLDLAFLPPPHGLGLHRVQANAIPSNTGSIRIMERAGFRYEGLARRYLRIDDRWQDHVMYAKLSDEHTPVFAVLNGR